MTVRTASAVEVRSAHTPGRWIATQRSFGYPETTGGPERLLWDVCNDNGVPIVLGSIVTENEANARLIAAAPELYDALREIADLLGAKTGYTSAGIVQALRTARAALSKVAP